MAKEELERKVQLRIHDLNELNNELQRSNSHLQQFVYVASHDLQEPLRKILTFFLTTFNSINTGYPT